jgi:hypothetical protein
MFPANSIPRLKEVSRQIAHRFVWLPFRAVVAPTGLVLCDLATAPGRMAAPAFEYPERM